MYYAIYHIRENEVAPSGLHRDILHVWSTKKDRDMWVAESPDHEALTRKQAEEAWWGGPLDCCNWSTYSLPRYMHRPPFDPWNRRPALERAPCA